MKELLFDMHVHTAGISRCSRVPAKELVRRCKLTGADGIVLTNHFAKSHVKGEAFDWRHAYEAEYHLTKQEGEAIGLRVLFGIEVTPETEGGKDYLIYGVDPSFLYQEKMLYEYTLPELSELVHGAGALLFHAHPYRGSSTPSDPTLIDGVEINCHPIYLDNKKTEVGDYASRYGLHLSCGSDYHGDVYKAPCGVYFPESVTNEADMKMAFVTGNYRLGVHDIDLEMVKKTNIHMGGKIEFED